MPNKYSLLLLFLLILTIRSGVHARVIQLENDTDVIYGNDDRYEVDEYPDPYFIEKARSVAIRVSKRRLTEDRKNNELVNFPFLKLKQAIPLICSTERFIEQFSIGDCSGFLIASNKLLTAGHCADSPSTCEAYKWVFDFKGGITQLKKNNIYSCKKIISQKYISNDNQVNDYALIELDRQVTNRLPLSYRKLGRVLLNTPLVIIGHPLGLPMKIADGAKVSRMNDQENKRPFHSLFMRKNYFTANIDSFAGNSGSPVFNQHTGKVEGIVVQGADDFIFNEEEQCFHSQILSNSHHNTFEMIMRINKVPGI